MIVTQSRGVWGFAHAHLNGFSDDRRNYLETARHGYRFLLDKFRDPEHGGYYWSTDLEGNPLNRRKMLYGEVFVIYAFVEYYRAGGGVEALEHALELFRVLQARCHDPIHGGWYEHFQPDWTPILSPEQGAYVERPGLKSANAHLHLMEAYTELFLETQDPSVKLFLKESLFVNREFFYPRDASRSAFHRHPDWSFVSDPESAGLSYGHNVEFAWLMIRAEKALETEPSWEHFYAHLNHALRHGYDHELGGLYDRGVENQPAWKQDKVWWVEAEMMAALTDALEHRPLLEHEAALKSLAAFLDEYQIEERDGIWLSETTRQGAVKNGGKANIWKGNYHDVRALVKFINAFAGDRPGDRPYPAN